MRRAAVAAAMSVALVLGGCDWTQGGFDGSNTGADPTAVAFGPATVTGLHQVWSVDDPSVAPARLTVVGDTVYASSTLPARFGSIGGPIGWFPGGPTTTTTTTTTTPAGPPPPAPLEALDASDGSVRWSAGGETVTNTVDHGQCIEQDEARAPLVEHGRLHDLASITTCADQPSLPFGHTSTIDTSTGVATLLDTSAFTVSDPVGDARATYATREGPAGAAETYAVVGTDGFRFAAPRPGGLGGPAIDRTTLFVADQGTLYAVDRSTGALRWTSGPGAGIHGETPTVGDGMVFLSTSNHLLAFDEAGTRGCSTTAGITSCAPVWDDALYDPSLPQFASDSPPAVSRDRLFLRRDNMLEVFDTRTGALLWQAFMSAHGIGGGGDEARLAQPSVAGSLVFVGTTDGRIVAYDTAGVADCAPAAGITTCQPLWTASLPGDASMSRPVIAGDAVYIASYGALVAGATEAPSTVTKFAF